MITAREAREISNRGGRSDLESIYELIRISAVNGRKSIYWVGHITPNDRDALLFREFTLEENVPQEARDQYSVTISW